MCKMSVASVLLLGLLIGFPALAQDASGGSIEDWKALDEEFRQVIVEEISARRGLDAGEQNPDSLIQTADDIREALVVSCEISQGDDCSDLTEPAHTPEPPGYTESKGMAIAEAILRARAGGEE